jgi:hypothetical protein
LVCPLEQLVPCVSDLGQPVGNPSPLDPLCASLFLPSQSPGAPTAPNTFNTYYHHEVVSNPSGMSDSHKLNIGSRPSADLNGGDHLLIRQQGGGLALNEESLPNSSEDKGIETKVSESCISKGIQS